MKQYNTNTIIELVDYFSKKLQVPMYDPLLNQIYWMIENGADLEKLKVENPRKLKINCQLLIHNKVYNRVIIDQILSNYK